MVELAFSAKIIRLVSLNFILPFVLIGFTPIRIVFDFFTVYHPDFFRQVLKLWNPFRNNSNENENSLKRHRNKTKDVQNQVRQWNKHGRNGLLCTGRPSWKTFNLKSVNKSKMSKIYIDMEDIIQIDTKNEVLMVEPGVKMGTLTSKLLKTGWTIPVIPEIESLTVGGCACGGGIETSSHKYGLFADTCSAFEVILADGKMVTCSKDSDPDLFYSIPGSHGTLGFLTAVYIKLIPAKKFVKLQYHPANSISRVNNLLIPEDSHEFIEGIVYGPNNFLVMYGDMVDEVEPDKIVHFLKWNSPWFYLHAQKKMTVAQVQNTKEVEYVPLRDYYHRHQRGLFWETAITLPYGNNPIFRNLFGWIMPINVQLMKIFTPNYILDYFSSKNHVLQDMAIPIDKLEQILSFTHETVEIYPLWLCPCYFRNVPGMVQPKGRLDGKFIDIGIYGLPAKVKEYELEKTTKKFEKWALENHGVQGLYAETFLTREEFKQMFDLKTYDKTRLKYGAYNAFPHIYDKVSREARMK